MATTKRVMCEEGDGTIKIVSVAYGLPGSEPLLEGESLDDYLVRIASANCPGSVSYTVIDVSDLPDRRWRDAFTKSGALPSVDLVKARTIRMNELKVIRDQKYADKLEEFRVAEDNGNDLTQLKADRIELRDMESNEQANLDAQATLNDIANFLPSYLQ